MSSVLRDIVTVEFVFFVFLVDGACSLLMAIVLRVALLTDLILVLLLLEASLVFVLLASSLLPCDPLLLGTLVA